MEGKQAASVGDGPGSIPSTGSAGLREPRGGARSPAPGAWHPGASPAPSQRTLRFLFTQSLRLPVTSLSDRSLRTLGGSVTRRLQAVNTAMAPVLSKDAADIEVPTARRVSESGRWGAPLVGVGEAAAVARERVGDPGNFASAGGLRGRWRSREPEPGVGSGARKRRGPATGGGTFWVGTWVFT